MAGVGADPRSKLLDGLWVYHFLKKPLPAHQPHPDMTEPDGRFSGKKASPTIPHSAVMCHISHRTDTEHPPVHLNSWPQVSHTVPQDCLTSHLPPKASGFPTFSEAILHLSIVPQSVPACYLLGLLFPTSSELRG